MEINLIIRKSFLIGLLAIIGLHSCTDSKKIGQHSESAEQIIPVTISKVSFENIQDKISYPATIRPLNEANLLAEVSGYITRIYIADGSIVTKGQPLYEIEGIRYRAAVQQAYANLQIAKTELTRQKRDLQRYQRLAEKDAIAGQIYDDTKTAFETSMAKLESAKAALLTANTDLARSLIRAPFSGTIGISYVRIGSLVNAGTTLLNTISSTDPIYVEFQVNEKDINRFLDLQHNQASNVISLTLPNGSPFNEAGTIAILDRAVDPSTGTIKVRSKFRNLSNMLRAGMNVTLHVSSVTTKSALVVPYKAIFEQLGVFNLYVVNDSSQAEIRQVKLGTKSGDKIEILDGVKNEEKIIVDGTMNVQNGIKVVNIEQK
ncbi:efflux transporter periplasmic adaptor subunit [Sphingobacterium siyangense]|uniref:Efflux transporter periplasmic adaptor subunit n=1 Tax=Sphingobacterium siyangense TaxID=459529 RepID=A0A420FXK3_9SPHI|nr:efflux RND transporter periplasmic adaptor subunit [Sphingobacterium siyangense]RKF37657.1 efflux transporter periplasmic adaptor subunit [Sphingobacterium siyangense]